MTDFLKQDIFFFVTTVAVVVVMILFAVLLVYLIRITKSVNYIVSKVRKETDIISEELAELRQNIRREGFRFKHLFNFIGKFRKK